VNWADRLSADSEGTVVESIESRADAEIGITVLGFGFLFQGLGYLLELAREPQAVAIG
jgi:hypothetical protein